MIRDGLHQSVSEALPRRLGGYEPQDVDMLVWDLQRNLHEVETEIAALRGRLADLAQPRDERRDLERRLQSSIVRAQADARRLREQVADHKRNLIEAKRSELAERQDVLERELAGLRRLEEEFEQFEWKMRSQLRFVLAGGLTALKQDAAAMLEPDLADVEHRQSPAPESAAAAATPPVEDEAAGAAEPPESEPFEALEAVHGWTKRWGGNDREMPLADPVTDEDPRADEWTARLDELGPEPILDDGRVPFEEAPARGRDRRDDNGLADILAYDRSEERPPRQPRGKSYRSAMFTLVIGVVMILAVGLAVGLAVVTIVRGGGSTPASTKTHSSGQAALAAVGAASPATPSGPTRSAGEPVDLVLTGTAGGTWVIVRRGSASGKTIFDGVIAGGESRSFEGRALWVRAGRPGSLQAKLDGKKMRALPSGAAGVLFTEGGASTAGRG